MARPARSQEPVRSGRVPVSSSRAPLEVRGKDANFYYRWVNDVDDRVSRFLDAGYSFVSRGEAKHVSTTVESASQANESHMKKSVGRGVVAYLMKLPMDLYIQDQKTKYREIDELEKAILRPGRGSVSQEVDYGKVSLTSRRGDEQTDFKEIEK